MINLSKIQHVSMKEPWSISFILVSIDLILQQVWWRLLMSFRDSEFQQDWQCLEMEEISRRCLKQSLITGQCYKNCLAPQFWKYFVHWTLRCLAVLKFLATSYYTLRSREVRTREKPFQLTERKPFKSRVLCTTCCVGVVTSFSANVSLQLSLFILVLLCSLPL